MRAAAAAAAATTFETKTCQTKTCQKERVPNGGVNTRRWGEGKSRDELPPFPDRKSASRAKKNSFPRRGSITCTSTSQRERRRRVTLSFPPSSFRESTSPNPRRIVRTFSTLSRISLSPFSPYNSFLPSSPDPR